MLLDFLPANALAGRTGFMRRVGLSSGRSCSSSTGPGVRNALLRRPVEASGDALAMFDIEDRVRRADPGRRTGVEGDNVDPDRLAALFKATVAAC